MLVWFMIVAILQQAGLKTFSSHESLWIIPLSCIGIFPCFGFFFFFLFFFIFFFLKEKKKNGEDRENGFSKKKKKKETGVQTTVLNERGKSGVICQLHKWCQVLDG